MSPVLIVAAPRFEGEGPSPLQRSLARQTDRGWTANPAEPEIFATILVDDDSSLDADAVATIRTTFTEHTALDALFGDAVIGGVRALRPAWSPTRLQTHADEVDLVAIRGRVDDASLATRIRALSAVPARTIGHLPVALLDRATPLPVDADATEALGELLVARRTVERSGPVTFLIPSAGVRDASGAPRLRGAIDAARRARRDGEGDKVLLIVGDEFDGDPHEHEALDVEILDRPFPWNFAAAINHGLVSTSTDIVVMLNDDVEALTRGWLEPMLDHLSDPAVGLVGATLLFPDGTIQHHGMVLDDAFPLHCHVGTRPGALPEAVLNAHEVVAVTAACVAANRQALLDVGGLWEALPANFNDADLCLKLLRTGRRVVLEPGARLVHHESASRTATIDAWEWDLFVGRWGGVEDPWYHPGHHRPDDPGDRRRNADHLGTNELRGTWPVRTPEIRCRPHRARLRPDTGDRPAE